MKESWQNLFDLVVKPSATFERLKSNPKWIFAFIVFCVFSLLLGWAHAPYTQKLISLQNANQLEFNNTASLISLIVSALVIAILWDIILSPILLIVANVFKINKEIKFKHIYTCLVHSSLVRVFVYLGNIGILPLFKNIESIETVIDVRILPGLHHLAGSNVHTNLLIFLSYINILSVWYLVVLAIAIATLTDVKRMTAYIVSILIWLIRTVAETVFAIVYLLN